jgi:hypothetical protein
VTTESKVAATTCSTATAVAHITTVNGWELHQVNIKTTFLQGKLELGEEVYMKQPQGFEAPGREEDIWELHKGLYGLPQGSHIWNKAINTGMVSLGFTRIKCKYCLYFCKTATAIILSGIHINDFFVTTSSSSESSKFKCQISSIWEISDLGKSQFCIGITIECDLTNHHIYLSQTTLIDKVLKQFNMTDCNLVSTPMESGLVLFHYYSIFHLFPTVLTFHLFLSPLSHYYSTYINI